MGGKPLSFVSSSHGIGITTSVHRSVSGAGSDPFLQRASPSSDQILLADAHWHLQWRRRHLISIQGYARFTDGSVTLVGLSDRQFSPLKVLRLKEGSHRPLLLISYKAWKVAGEDYNMSHYDKLITIVSLFNRLKLRQQGTTSTKTYFVYLLKILIQWGTICRGMAMMGLVPIMILLKVQFDPTQAAFPFLWLTVSRSSS